MAKSVYIKCPRCDLNFILKKEKLCPVCKSEMAALTQRDDDAASLGVCPICKVNYITDDETVCGTCSDESELSKEELDALYGGISVDKGDNSDPEDEITDDDDELEMVSLVLEDEDMDEDMEDDERDSLDDDFDENLDA